MTFSVLSKSLKLKQLKGNYNNNHSNLKIFYNVVCSELSKNFLILII